MRHRKIIYLKIVREVENGLPRKEAIRIYGLGASSLPTRMRDYGWASFGTVRLIGVKSACRVLPKYPRSIPEGSPKDLWVVGDG